MSNKRGIAFYLDKKFIVYNEKEVRENSILIDYDLKKCFENSKHVIYSYDCNDIIIRVFGDSLIFISDKKYEQENGKTSIIELIKLANIILSVMFWTSSEYLNLKKGKNNFFIHNKEINTQNIFHCISKDDVYNEIEFESCNGLINLDDFTQRENIKAFERNNQSNFVYDLNTVSEFFNLFEKNLNIIIEKNLQNIIFMLYRSTLEAQKSNFDISILLSFFVIESVINSMWNDTLKEKELYKKLQNDINYTMAIKSNMLYVHGIISKEELEEIDFARKKRNNIAHVNFEEQDKLNSGKIFSITSRIFYCATKLFSKYYNIDFKMQFGITI